MKSRARAEAAAWIFAADCGNSERTRRNTSPGMRNTTRIVGRAPAGSAQEIGQQRRLADQGARFDATPGVVGHQIDRARQHKISRVRRLALDEQRLAGFQNLLGAGERQQLQRLARQEIEGVRARHYPDIGFKAHRAALRSLRS